MDLVSAKPIWRSVDEGWMVQPGAQASEKTYIQSGIEIRGCRISSKMGSSWFPWDHKETIALVERHKKKEGSIFLSRCNSSIMIDLQVHKCLGSHNGSTTNNSRLHLVKVIIYFLTGWADLRRKVNLASILLVLLSLPACLAIWGAFRCRPWNNL